MKKISVFLLFLSFSFIFTGAADSYAADNNFPTEKAVLTEAPEVPPAIKRDHPANVVVELEVQEVTLPIADGAEYTFWTFGGKVPGKFIRVREGDLVEFHLANHPSSKLPHNIDLHAVTGPGGGAASSFTAPGHKSVFKFTALNAGLYVYHCAVAPVGMHVANGMYGLIYVQPKEALPEVDKEYYVMQGEFYTPGNFNDKGLQQFSMENAIKEQPTYVLFNGRVNALSGEGAITAKVGERVRLYIGNGGPNLISSFHVIGEIFDSVYTEGGTEPNQQDVQTTLVPAGGSAIVEFDVQVPGSYVLVDHSLFRAFNKGALGILKVDGPEDKLVYSGKELDEVYLGGQLKGDKKLEDLRKQYAKEIKGTPKLQKLSKEMLLARGETVYASTCQMCHMGAGEGVKGVFPPLAGSDYMQKIATAKNRDPLIGIVVNGLSGPITVSGVQYNSVMPPIGGVSDDDIAAVLTYVTNSWGNSASIFTEEEVVRARSGLGDQAAPLH